MAQMGAEFDWKLLEKHRWVPLSHICQAPRHIVHRLFLIAPGFYAMTNVSFGGTTEDDPGVGAILWARSRLTALTVYDRQIFEVGSGREESTPPPVEIMGFHPYTRGAVLAFEKGRGERPIQTAVFRFNDGKFTHTTIVGSEREYHFSSINPADTEEFIAVTFSLPERPEDAALRMRDSQM